MQVTVDPLQGEAQLEELLDFSSQDLGLLNLRCT